MNNPDQEFSYGTEDIAKLEAMPAEERLKMCREAFYTNGYNILHLLAEVWSICDPPAIPYIQQGIKRKITAFSTRAQT